MLDAKKYGLFDNIRFPQLRFYCKYYKKKFAYRIECPEIIANIYSDILRFSISNHFFYARQKFRTATSLTQPLAHYPDDPRGYWQKFVQ